MFKKKIPTNDNVLQREEFSSFVIDLRQKEQQIAKEVKKEEKKVKKNFRVKFAVAEKAVKKMRPDLLVKDKGLSLKRYFIFNRRPKTTWQKIVQAERDIFRAKPVVDKELLRERKRADRAEQTVYLYRSAISFTIALILIILPFKLMAHFELFNLAGWEQKIMSRSVLGLNNLMAAADSVSKMDLKKADSNFQAAGTNFLAATDDLNQINDAILALASFSNNPKVKLAAESKKFLLAGATASSLGRNLVLATDSLFNGNKSDFTSNLDHFLTYGHNAVNDAQELKRLVSQIDVDNLPAEYRDKFLNMDKQVGLLADNLDNFVAAGDKLKEVLGLSRDKRYLFIFQNNSELRASGGFLGSYALVDFREGKIRNLEVPGGGSYDTEAGMKVRVAAPKPLWLVNPLWHFWDANWWPDFPTTAQNLMWFYDKSDGPSVDGVISVTPTVVERLLEITGPIDLTKEYGITIDANNFWDTVQKITEQKNLAKSHPEAITDLPATSSPISSNLPLKQNLENNQANKPKKIIGDLMAKILEVLPQKLTKDNLVKIISLFEENMSEKQILFYFTDPALQSEVSNQNWSGEIRNTDKDYLLVVNTNIAGQKSDRLMAEKIDETSEVGADGSIINTVKITRTHTGVKNAPLTGVRNVDWMRIYVPEGSQLLMADGFRIPEAKFFSHEPESGLEDNPLLVQENAAKIEASSGTNIYEENNKTVFANWLMVDPGETAVVTLKYRLPFNFFSKPADNSWWKKVNDWLNPQAAELQPYSLLVQKQPGARPSDFSSRLILPSGLTIFWRHPDSLSGTNGWQINDRVDSDKFWSVLIMKNNK